MLLGRMLSMILMLVGFEGDGGVKTCVGGDGWMQGLSSRGCLRLAGVSLLGREIRYAQKYRTN